MKPFDLHLRTRVVFGAGTFDRLGELARELEFTRTLLVSDAGILATGQVDRATGLLEAAKISTFGFHDFESNPDSEMVEAGRRYAETCSVDSIVALGGGSALDCAKGINFLLTNGGTMHDYRGFGRAARPMLPMIGVPTTAGTGSEAQTYAIISDARTHAKMACGDPKAAFRVAILDPVLTVSQPAPLTAVTGFDAISHAVESYVTVTQTDMSDVFAREAWRLLERHYERVLANPGDLDARSAMLLGANLAGTAVEQSMLGATHACANPLTGHYGTTHGIAIAVMLPHVVRWNADSVASRYRDLLRVAGLDRGEPSGERLASRLAQLARAGGLPGSLRELGVPADALSILADDAAAQWTGTFNPRPFDRDAALRLYQAAYQS